MAIETRKAPRADRTVQPPVRPTGRRTRMRPGGWFTVAAVVAFLGLGLVAFWPVLPWTSSRLFGVAGDSILATWFFAWIPHSLANGLNPFYTHAMMVPTGVNLAQNTESPLLGLATAPFAVVLGPIARGNLMAILAMPVSATAALIVLRRLGVWNVAAAIGGLLYGFSPYAVGQSLGHVVLVFLPLPPFIALTVVRILRGEGSKGRLGVRLGLLCAAQYLCEPEVFAAIVIVGVWVLFCAAVRYRSSLGDAVRRAAMPGGIAIGITAALIAYPAWMLLAGPQRYHGTAQGIPNPYYNDLFSYVVPGQLQRFSLGLGSVSIHTSNSSEAGSYIGIPVICLVLFFAWRSRRSARMQLAFALLFGAALLGLGPRLVVLGHMTSVPLPSYLLEHMPLVDNILPARFGYELAAGVAAVISFGIDDLRRTTRLHVRQTSRTAVVVSVGTLIAIVVTQLPVWPYQSQVVQSLPAQLRAAIPRSGPVALTYPFASPVFPQPMAWQMSDGFAFSLIGGYGMHPGPTGGPNGFPNAMNPPELQNFLQGQEDFNKYIPRVPITPQLFASARTTLLNYRIRVIIADASTVGARTVLRFFRGLLGPPTVVDGSFYLWRVHTR